MKAGVVDSDSKDDSFKVTDFIGREEVTDKRSYRWRQETCAWSGGERKANGGCDQ